MSCVLFLLQVYGALRAIDEGTHAQYTLVPQDSVSITCLGWLDSQHRILANFNFLKISMT